MIKIFFSLISVFCFCNLFSQTVVIYKKTKDAIYVASDSRTGVTTTYLSKEQNSLPNYFKKETYIDSACKIKFVNNIGTAFLGLYMDLSYKCALEAANKNKSSNDVIKQYINSYTYKLRDSLESLRLKDPIAFDMSIDPLENTLSEVLFFGYEADTLFIKYIYFMRKDPELTNGSVQIIVQGRNGDADAYCLGKREQVEDTLKKPSVWNKGIVQTMNNLVAIASKANLMTVGGPVDIVKVTRKGVIWIQRKKYCK